MKPAWGMCGVDSAPWPPIRGRSCLRRLEAGASMRISRSIGLDDGRWSCQLARFGACIGGTRRNSRECRRPLMLVNKDRGGPLAAAASRIPRKPRCICTPKSVALGPSSHQPGGWVRLAKSGDLAMGQDVWLSDRNGSIRSCFSTRRALAGGLMGGMGASENL